MTIADIRELETKAKEELDAVRLVLFCDWSVSDAFGTEKEGARGCAGRWCVFFRFFLILFYYFC